MFVHGVNANGASQRGTIPWKIGWRFESQVLLNCFRMILGAEAKFVLASTSHF